MSSAGKKRRLAEADASRNKANKKEKLLSSSNLKVRKKSAIRENDNNDDDDPDNDKNNNKTKTTKKRQQSSREKSRQSSPSSKVRRQRPPPPPPPPPSLVKLLQSDPAVLQYFQSLQANLEADVQIWKDRAKEFQQEKEQLEKELKRKKKNFQQEEVEFKDLLPFQKKKGHERITASTTPNHGQDKGSDDGETDAKGSSGQPPQNGLPENSEGGVNDSKVNDEGVPIDESMLEFSSSDDDENGDENFKGDNGINQADLGVGVMEPDGGSDHDDEAQNQLDLGGNGTNDDDDDVVVAMNGSNHDKCGDVPVDKVDDDESQLEKRMHQALFALDSSSDEDDEDKKEGDAPITASGDEDGNDESSDDTKDYKAPNVQPEKRRREALFALDSSSDDSDDDDREARAEPVEAFGGGASLLDETIPCAPVHQAVRPETILLREAFGALERLGVPLVEEKIDGTESEPSQEAVHDGAEGPAAEAGSETIGEDMGSSPNPKLRRIWIARSDEDVAADLAWAIHSLSRVQLIHKDLAQTHPPFVTSQLIPTCNYYGSEESEGDVAQAQAQHPIIEGRTLLFRALMILDTYCTSDLYSENEWAEMLQIAPEGSRDDDDDDSVALKMAIGLNDRKRMVKMFIDSLDSEIIQSWPVYDRSNMFETPAFHLDDPDNLVLEGQSEDIPGDGMADEKAMKAPETIGPSMDPKIQARMSNLLERCVHVQLLVGFYLSRDDPDRVSDLLWRYILSNAPSQDEDFPKLAPTMSFVVLESMLLPQPKMMWWLTAKTSAFGQPHNLWGLLFWREEEQSKVATAAQECLDLVLCFVASIFSLRDEKGAKNARIRDWARVEIAAYNRLAQLGILGVKKLVRNGWENEVCAAAEELCQRLEGLEWKGGGGLASLAYQLCMIFRGQGFVGTLNACVDGCSGPQFVARCRATKEIEIRALDKSRSAIGTPGAESTLFQYHAEVPAGTAKPSFCLGLGLLHGAAILANGNSVCRIAEDAIECMIKAPDLSDETKALVSSMLEKVSQRPLVRVINLKSRTDRMRAFYLQAMSLNIKVVHAVASLEDGENDRCVSRNMFFGGYAFDGRGRWSEASERLSTDVDHRLSSFVATHWRPNDLKAFDSNAPDEEFLVRTSPSEQACALSHIASWKGCLRSFQIVKEKSVGESSLIVREPWAMKRLFHLSGFAQGPALHSSNKKMPPMPVCVILEDDAILVDRFADRLQDLLRELPRDFHFCSLGYSRPKAAPIVSYRKHVGIPTNLFYLTGYVISEAGAEYLLHSLPVVGPVDSWIGIKMTDNFDNIFGTKVGVGRNSKPVADPLAPKDLCTILRFRAYCAMQPLCSQRVGNPGGRSERVRKGDRGWRHRDTDIDYSGNLGSAGRN